MKAVILAAGKGTRLMPYSKIVPKALMPIGINKDGSFCSIIEKLISQIKAAGIKEIFIVINHKAEMIQEYLGDGKTFGCRIKYAFQETLDGNAGAFYKCQHRIGEEDVFVTDCDNYMEDDSFITKMRKKHDKSKTDLTVAVSHVKNISKFAIIKVDKKMNPLDIFEKPTDEKEWGNLAKSGMMMLSNRLALENKVISLTPKGEYTTTQIIKYCIMHPKKFKVQLFNISAGFSDIGTWAEYLPILRKNL